MLCGPCRRALEEPHFSRISPASDLKLFASNRDYRYLHTGLASLTESLASGCGVCHRFLDHLASRGQSKIFTKDLQICEDIENAPFFVAIRVCYEGHSRRLISCGARFFARKSGSEVKETCYLNLYLAVEQRPLTDTSTLHVTNGIDSSSIDVIKLWLDVCNRYHYSCRRRRNSQLSGRRFARILEIGHDLDVPVVKLKSSADLPKDLVYATLSHCWGGGASQIPSLTKSNYADYLRTIVVSDLPRTFQDAIQLARRLNIGHLWIDSLCIIQDSEEDWLDQAAAMGETYQGSYLNIAATMSENPNGGLFTERNPVHIKPLRIAIFGELPDGETPSAEDTEPFLRLEQGPVLVSSRTKPSSRPTTTCIEMDARIGNDNGQFQLGGKNFSHSARNLVLHGYMLHAELRTLSGDWAASNVDVRMLLHSSSHVEKLEFQGPSMLIVTSDCFSNVGEESRLDLNACIGNRNGAFDLRGNNFARSARNITLKGTNLSADLCAVDGKWLSRSMDLSGFVDWSTGTLRTSPAPRKARLFYDVDNDPYSEWALQLSGSKLINRGWIVQERLLSPRVVHFANRQLFWECVCLQALETDPKSAIDCQQALAKKHKVDFKTWDIFSNDLVQPLQERPLGPSYIWSSLKAMHGEDTRTPQHDGIPIDKIALDGAWYRCYGTEKWQQTHPMIRYWSEIVSTYSNSKLTFDSDRLIAIAGIARILSYRTGMRYVAGLWADQLPRQLLWNYPHMGDRYLSAQPKTDSSFVAPSWSWATRRGFVGPQGVGIDPLLESKGAMDLIRVLDISVDGFREDDTMPFGRVKGGYLRIRSRLIPITLDMGLWPEGVVRKDHMVQFWTGSQINIPTRETFIAPVLFTRWDRLLPNATPNSLLLEWTGKKGVFHRIGTARLSSRYPLGGAISELYHSPDIYPENPENESDMESDDEDQENATSLAAAAKEVKPNPQQERSDRFHELIGLQKNDSFTDKISLAQLEDRFKQHLSTPGPMAELMKGHGADINGLRMVYTVLNTISSQMSGKSNMPIDIERLMGAGMTREMAIELSQSETPRSRTQASAETPSQESPSVTVEVLSPKEAVGSQFYREFVDADDDVVRFGHFVVDIV